MKSPVPKRAATATMGTATLLIQTCTQSMVYEEHLVPSTCHPLRICLHACAKPNVYTLHFVFIYFQTDVSPGCVPCLNISFLQVELSECWWFVQWMLDQQTCKLSPLSKSEVMGTGRHWAFLGRNKITDINLANLNAPGAIPQTFTFASTRQYC